jgi:excinuclease UvrABC ATPase subunit
MKDEIIVKGAREKNLQNIDVYIPKKEITVVVGPSGSGKSALVFDTIAAESQRQMNENYSSFIRTRLGKFPQPKCDEIKRLSPSIIIDQKKIGDNSRSTVGTVTDIYSKLRLLFSRFGSPFVGYSDVFSFNNPKGMCEICEGVGKIRDIDIEKIIDKNKSLNEGAILFPTFQVGGFRWSRYMESGLFDNDRKIRDYSEKELYLLLYPNKIKLENPSDKYPESAIYDGVIPRIKKTFFKKDSREGRIHKHEIDKYAKEISCPKCNGARLKEDILKCKINNKNIYDYCRISIENLIIELESLSIKNATELIDSILKDLYNFRLVGLDYLSLNRNTGSLSGGESQRIKIIKQLGNSLVDLLYILDEPSVGLHPEDTLRIDRLLIDLKKKGNTILIVEHDIDVIKIADNIIELGPESGKRGGKLIFSGKYEDFLISKTLTSNEFKKKNKLNNEIRPFKEWLEVNKANTNNLKNIDVKIPKNAITVVTGVAGSGKSSLMGIDFRQKHPEGIFIDQKKIYTSVRSIVSSYIGILDYIRNIFAEENDISPSYFSFNSKGACAECGGKGYIKLDLAFMDDIVSECEACNGKRYNVKALKYKVDGLNISQVLDLSIKDALWYFKNFNNISMILQTLIDVGIGYLTLGQSLDTLSGGELQRLKLSTNLNSNGNIYVFDEPTTGLHVKDIYRLIKIFKKLSQNNTIIIIEHNLEIMSIADWIIDLGPYAGEKGGYLLYQGRIEGILESQKSITGRHLRKCLEE